MTQEQIDKLNPRLAKNFKDFYSYDNSIKGTMDLLTERFTSPISDTLSEVIFDMFSREQLGLKKYGTTIDRDDYDLKDWLQHALEEAMDSVLYLKKAIQQLENK